MKYLLRYISGMILKFVKTSAMQNISGRKQTNLTQSYLVALLFLT